MPFKSEKQKKFLFVNKPKLAKRWSKEYKEGAEVKKKPKMGYKEEGTVKEVDIAKNKNIKIIKIKLPGGKTKTIKIPNPFTKPQRLGSSKLVRVKKGGKV